MNAWPQAPDFARLLAPGTSRGREYTNTAQADSAMEDGGYQANRNNINQPQNRPRRVDSLTKSSPEPMLGR